MGISSSFTWLGQRVTDALLGDIDMRLHQAGQAVVTEAKALVHVDTGATRASIGYRIENRTLVIYVGQPSGIFLEYGTRHSRPYPYLRPALSAVGRIFGGSIEMEFNSLASGAGAGWQGIHAVGRGFVVPSAIQPRPLTQAQHRHVQKHLVPTSKKLWHGNVKRAKLRVRRFGS